MLKSIGYKFLCLLNSRLLAFSAIIFTTYVVSFDQDIYLFNLWIFISLFYAHVFFNDIKWEISSISFRINWFYKYDIPKYFKRRKALKSLYQLSNKYEDK